MKKILVIDDDDLCRQMIVLALEQEGYDMLEAADGEEGIRIARMYLPDLILCDVVMDNIDGYTTLATLHHERPTAFIPFILMSGKSDHYDRREGFELGADEFLTKPFHISELLRVVNSRLRKNQPADARPTFNLSNEATLANRNTLSLALPHELRNPLNLILGFAETMQNDYASLQPEEIAEMASAIRDSTLRLERSIGNALIFSQLEHLVAENRTAPAPTEEQTSNIEKVVEPMACYKAQQAGRAADLELRLGDLPVAVPKEHLSKIVDELLDNAFRYSTSGTPVKAMTTMLEEDVLLSVSDRGKGMPPQQLESLIHLVPGNAHEAKGTGYGLAIVKKLTQLHGGDVDIRSKAGAGTTVVVKLPNAGHRNGAPEQPLPAK